MPELRIQIDGQDFEVPVGSTVAAALIQSGRTSWRRTRTGEPRGLFCGMGVCFDCLVELNGVEDVRACIAEVRDGDQIKTSEAADAS